MTKWSIIIMCTLTTILNITHAQVKWIAVDSINNTMPNSVQLYYTHDSIAGKPNIAYCIIADLTNEQLEFTVDTTANRRLTPSQFYNRNQAPLVIVNSTFFNYSTNASQNVVIKDGRVVAHNLKAVQRKLADSIMHTIPIQRSAIGISKNRKADIAWIATDSSKTYAMAKQKINQSGNCISITDSTMGIANAFEKSKRKQRKHIFKKWNVQTAIGGGPVLIQNGQVCITNEQEKLFEGKALYDKHPRTAMGYTADAKLIILVIQGRYKGIAEGATLQQEADMLLQLGCVEALNLDGGGSSCMLVQGKETIQPSEKTGQRPVPAIFLIKKR